MKHDLIELKLSLELAFHNFLNSFTYCSCTRCKQSFRNSQQGLICKSCLENSLLTKSTGLKLSEAAIKIYFSSLYKESLIKEVIMENALDIEEQLKFNQEEILKLKQHKPNLSLLFSEYLSRFFEEYPECFLDKADEKLIITYVPAHANRRYNQAFLLAKYFYKDLYRKTAQKSLKFKPLFLKNLFFRVKETKKLANLNPEERQQELKNAFTLNEKIFKRIPSKNFKLVIIDDISTTGATIDALARLLLNRGVQPEQIRGFSVLGRNCH